MWAEMNAYHSADVAKTILEEVDKGIAEAKALRDKRDGNIDPNLFQAYWSKISNKLQNGGKDATSSDK